VEVTTDMMMPQQADFEIVPEKSKETQLRKLTHFENIELNITGKVFVGYYSMEGWSGKLPFYAFKCPTHGTVFNHPMGFDKRHECPQCLAKRLSQLDYVAAVRSLEVPD
jgi:hypothetical protein